MGNGIATDFIIAPTDFSHYAASETVEAEVNALIEEVSGLAEKTLRILALELKNANESPEGNTISQLIDYDISVMSNHLFALKTSPKQLEPYYKGLRPAYRNFKGFSRNANLVLHPDKNPQATVETFDKHTKIGEQFEEAIDTLIEYLERFHILSGSGKELRTKAANLLEFGRYEGSPAHQLKDYKLANGLRDLLNKLTETK